MKKYAITLLAVSMLGTVGVTALAAPNKTKAPSAAKGPVKVVKKKRKALIPATPPRPVQAVANSQQTPERPTLSLEERFKMIEADQKRKCEEAQREREKEIWRKTCEALGPEEDTEDRDRREVEEWGYKRHPGGSVYIKR